MQSFDFQSVRVHRNGMSSQHSDGKSVCSLAKVDSDGEAVSSFPKTDSDSLLLIADDVFRYNNNTVPSSEEDADTQGLQGDEIRLVKILPGRTATDRLVRCQSMVVSLDSKPDYLALSYTWGAPPSLCTIEIDGRQVLVRKNVWRFFDQVHEDRLDRPIWIDSICINQSSSEEVTQQIRLMGSIYSQAASVLLWLGPAHSDSDLAMESLVNHSDAYQRSRKQASFWNGPSGIAVARLCQRAYWSRLWIFQELMLAQNIVILCGERALAWDKLCNVMAANLRNPRRLYDRNTDYQAVSRSPAMSIVDQQLNPLDYRLWELMLANRSLKCWEPKDRIFGLLGVAKKAASIITPDYKVPLCRLLNEVLRFHHWEQRPASIEVVASECSQLTEMFGLSTTDIFNFESHDEERVIERSTLKRRLDCPIGNITAVGVTLWWVMFYDHKEVQRLLIGNATKSPQQVFDWAVTEGDPGSINVLWQSGRVEFSAAQVAFRKTCRLGKYKLEVAKVLLDLGVDPDVEIIGDEVSGSALDEVARVGNAEMVSLLLSHGADVTRSTSNALRQAAAGGHDDIVRTFLKKGADVNGGEGGKKQTPLCAAIINYQHVVIQTLLQHGADPNIPSVGSGSALHAAAYMRSEAMVDVILRYGANVNLRNRYGRTALDETQAAGNYDGYEKLVATLIKAGAHENRDILHPIRLEFVGTNQQPRPSGVGQRLKAIFNKHTV